MLEYPTAGLGLSGPPRPWALALRPVLLGMPGLAIAVGTVVLLRRRRRLENTTGPRVTDEYDRHAESVTAQGTYGETIR